MSPAFPPAFGSFQVLHQVGAGAQGPIYRAADPERQRLVAIKCFRLGLAPDLVHRLVAELDRLVIAGAAHPAFAEPLAAGIEGVDAYLAEEYLAGESLDTVLRERGALPVADALRVCRHLAEAFDLAASASLAHGALHPRDVLLTGDGPRVTGLGIAAALESIGVAAPVRRPYAAPERAAGGAWTSAADRFSLAALAHEMLTGRRTAGTGRGAADALTAIEGFDSRKLRDVFARALVERPDDRFATAAEFIDALDAALRHGLPTGDGRLPTEQPQAPDRFTEIDVTPESPFGGDPPSHRHSSMLAGPHPRSPLLLDSQTRSSQQPRALWRVAAVLAGGAILGSAVAYFLSSWLMAQGL